MKKHLLYILLLLFCTLGSFAQETKELTGTVKDENNEPLIGVTIVVKDKPGFGTATDANGHFKIKVNPYQILIFSYIGFDKQEIPVKEQTVLNVIMKEAIASALDEVTVTATGVKKKVSVTGAITTVDIKDLHTSTANLTNALAGNVAGIIARQSSGEPGKSNSQFWIRGISTFGADQEALVLVDGFERSFDEINIEDIETFSVLKDASATAIYGSKGANGVILITTKKGNAGKVNISGRVEYTYNTRTRTPEFTDGYTYALMANEAKRTRNLEPLYSDYELDLFKEKLDPDLYPNVDWNDVLLRDGASTYQASVNMSGGGSTARYFVSVRYINEQGMYNVDSALKDYKTNSNRKLWNYRINVDMDITKTTLLHVGISGSLDKQNRPGLADDIWPSLIGQTPVSIPLMYSNGLVPAYGTGYQTNPWVLATQTGYREGWKNKIQTTMELSQNLSFVTKGLRFIGRFAFDTNNENENQRVKWPEQYQAERKRDRNGNLIMKRISTEQLLKQTSSSSGERIYNVEAELHYDRSFSDAHRIGAMVKYLQRERANTSDVGEDMIKGVARRNMGVSGMFTYGYKDRYLAEFDFGYTGSENFDKEHRWGFFPALSLGWNVAEENFIKKNLPWLEMFKIRYSWGEVGSDKLPDDKRFPFLSDIGGRDGYNYGQAYSDNNYGGLFYTMVSSPKISWEIAKKQNLGFDINAFHNRFSLVFDLFKDSREKIYVRRTHLPSMVGITSEPFANIGKMEGKGFDGNFRYHEKFGEVEMTLRGNLTYTKNEVIESDEEANAYSYKMEKGFRYQQARGLIAEGLFKDYNDIRNSPQQTYGEYMPGDIKYKDVNGDGQIDDNDIVPIGATTIPNVMYGFAVEVLWKNFNFNIRFQGAGKSAYFLNGPTIYPFSEGAWGNILTEAAESGNRWISREISGDAATENVNAKYPRLSYGGNGNNYRNSTYWLRDGSYLRLKEIELGYRIPNHLTRKWHMHDVRLYLNCNNLAVWDKLKVWDPELGIGDGMKYPPSKTFTVGLTLNF